MVVIEIVYQRLSEDKKVHGLIERIKAHLWVKGMEKNYDE